ncbi:hypothetical protein [Vibrio agarivorans]|uniref:PRTRC system protein B n=1 Tax=Vibrio agarivorans TaxID=153622 RepID=A0ABT7Y747_9VIBR|nr:hypothetical protein [Vibrio agarivorans]MDN2483880.1 hypothetical protein [Vibrio agarivorans]
MFYTSTSSEYQDEVVEYLEEMEWDEQGTNSYQCNLYMVESLGTQTFITQYDTTKENTAINPVVISPSDLITKLRESTNEDGELDIIDPRLLVDNGTCRVWVYTPEPDQPLYYNYGKKQRVQTVKKWCPLLFKMVDGKLYVAALRYGTRPKMDTRIYHVPLPNVYSNGSICLGDVKLPKHFDVDAVSKAYLDSNKSHLNYTGGFRRKGTLKNEEYFEWLIRRDSEPMRVSELSVMGTVEQFIRGEGCGL